jgi:hypothetical protein
LIIKYNLINLDLKAIDHSSGDFLYQCRTRSAVFICCFKKALGMSTITPPIAPYTWLLGCSVSVKLTMGNCHFKTLVVRNEPISW